jgi:hypothetical protein
LGLAFPLVLDLGAVLALLLVVGLALALLFLVDAEVFLAIIKPKLKIRVLQVIIYMLHEVFVAVIFLFC